MITPRRAYAPLGSLPLLARVNLALLGAGIVALTGLLLPRWRHDPDLSHGFAVPLLFLILVAESRSGSRPRWIRRSFGASVLSWLSLALAVFCVAAAGLYGSALGLSHAMTCFFASSGLALLLLSAWMALADEAVGFVSFGWPAVVALALWPLASPLPPGSYTRLSLALQGGVTEAVTGTLGLFGIAAYRDGHVIQLAHTSVGVSEACSGVRSLISCVVAGLFLSAVWVKRPWARVFLVVLAPVLALFMNFIRSLILTLIANARGEIGNGWHDGTGIAIIAVTTLILGAAAIALGKGNPGKDAASPVSVPRLRPRRQGILALTLGVLAVLLGTLAAARWPGHHPPGPKAPDLEALFPPAPRGWQVHAERDMAQYSGILQTSLLARRTYATRDARGPLFVTLYVAYWLPSQASASLVAAHTPDFCWPGTGWVAEPSADARIPLPVDGRVLPPAECRLFSHAGYATHVWFWHLFARQPLIEGTPYTVRGLLELALTYGLHHDGDQLFVMVSSNRGWNDIAPDPTVMEFFRRVAPLGL